MLFVFKTGALYNTTTVYYCVFDVTLGAVNASNFTSVTKGFKCHFYLDKESRWQNLFFLL